MGLEYEVHAEQVVPNVSTARAKLAQVYFDSSPDQSDYLMNPAELLLSAFAACMLKNIERFAKILHFSYERVSIRVHGVREDTPPRMSKISYELTLWTDESDQRVELLRRNLHKYGTVFNTLKASCEVSGRINVETSKHMIQRGEQHQGGVNSYG
jgi:uncharacterized OsmC-like protein